MNSHPMIWENMYIPFSIVSKPIYIVVCMCPYVHFTIYISTCRSIICTSSCSIFLDCFFLCSHTMPHIASKFNSFSLLIVKAWVENNPWKHEIGIFRHCKIHYSPFVVGCKLLISKDSFLKLRHFTCPRANIFV